MFPSDLVIQTGVPRLPTQEGNHAGRVTQLPDLCDFSPHTLFSLTLSTENSPESERRLLVEPESAISDFSQAEGRPVSEGSLDPDPTPEAC